MFVRLLGLQPLGFVVAAFLVFGGALQHGLILGLLGFDQRNWEQLKLGLGYDLMHGCMLAGLTMLLLPWVTRSPRGVRRVLWVWLGSFYFFLFVDYTYVTQFGTHLPYSTIEYLDQLGEFGSTMNAAFGGAGFWLLFLLPLGLWSAYLFFLRQTWPQWYLLHASWRDFVFWMFLGALAGIAPNSRVDKNLNEPLTSNSLVYFYWSRNFERDAQIAKPEAALLTVAQSLSGTAPKEPGFEDYPLVRDHLARGCREQTRLAWALCGKRQPNILFVLMESYRAADNTSFGSPLNLTPGFEKLRREGVLFRNFFANGFQTRHGQVATFCSLVPNYGAPVMKNYLSNHYLCLPEMLNQAGYQTSILFGTSASFDNQARFLPVMGFNQVLDSLEFNERTEMLGWGASDRSVFNRWLDHLSQAQEPFFSAMMSITNHHPFEVPESFRVYGAKDGQSRYFEALRYSDQMLYEFVQKAKTQSWWDNTLIFVLADTSNYQPAQIEPKDFPEFVRLRSQIPLLILGGALRGGSYEERAYHDQIDLAPTVLDLLRTPYRAAFAGESLMSLRPGIAQTNRPGNYWAVMSEEGAVYWENGRYPHVSENMPPSLAEDYNQLGRSWNLAQQWMLQEDKIWKEFP
ncbi:MAG: LTA synthase family protein [bacterium]|nr:LTA synthase family protein [bacterium]